MSPPANRDALETRFTQVRSLVLILRAEDVAFDEKQPPPGERRIRYTIRHDSQKLTWQCGMSRPKITPCISANRAWKWRLTVYYLHTTFRWVVGLRLDNEVHLDSGSIRTSNSRIPAFGVCNFRLVSWHFVFAALPKKLHEIILNV